MEARARRAVMSDVVARNGMLEPRVVHSFDLGCRVSTSFASQKCVFFYEICKRLLRAVVRFCVVSRMCQGICRRSAAQYSSHCRIVT